MKTRIKIGIIVIFLMIGVGIIISGNFSHSTTDEKEQQPMIDPMITRTISGENVNVYLGTFGNITINAPTPESPSTVTVFRGVINSGDLMDVSLGSFIGDGINVPSEKDAPEIAIRILNAYGGLPQDAIFWGASTSYSKSQNSTTSEVTIFTDDTMVTWKRQLNNRSITGDTDIIRVLLGDNGNPIWVYKEWRTYTNSGDVPVIPVEKAIEKLENGDTIGQYLDANTDVNIYNITLGYYVKGFEEPIVTVEPVWIFSGNATSGSGVSFKVYARQFANFTATPTSGAIPLTVSFTDTSDTSPTKWFWDFGDGTNSTDQSPTHTYTTAGIYNVSLKAWNDLGSDTIERKNFIQAGTIMSPVANFTAIPNSGKAPLTVQFNDTSENSPTSWVWDFGDGTTSMEQNLTYTYLIAGNYTVNLTAANADGEDTKSEIELITVLPLDPPVPDFTADPLSGKAPLTVQFNDSSSGGIPTLRVWEFGDGTISTEQDPVHTYTAAGSYTVSLELANGDADVFENKTDYITVLPPVLPVVAFSANTTNGKAPLAVQFTDVSSNAPSAWEWNFGDGYVATEQNPVHRYSVSGTYDVTLNAINGDGSGNLTKPAYITVTEPGNAIDLIDQLIVYIDNQQNVPHIYQRIMIGELMDVKRSLNQNRPGDAVMGMKFFKLTVNLFRPWPLTKDQASTMQNSADAIIKAINLPVNQAAIDQTKSLSADVKALHLSNSVESPLLWNLDNAQFMLECGKDKAAATYLNIFIGSVRAQDGKKIPHDKAARLIAKAEAIKTIL